MQNESLFGELSAGNLPQTVQLQQLAKTDLLILDDWAIAPIAPADRRDLLEILDDRVQTRSTLVTSQLPIDAWHTWIEDPTLADAILDRLVHNAHRMTLRGESLRKQSVDLTDVEQLI